LINAYGLRIFDVGTPVTRFLEVEVQHNEALGGDIIRLLLQDFAAGTVETLGVVPLAPPQGADHVWLNLRKPDANSNNVFGGYQFATGISFPAPTNWTLFSTPGAMFANDVTFIRPQFLAFAAVPEPATLLLLAAALVGLGIAHRPKQS
jgi:hypothetical protein